MQELFSGAQCSVDIAGLRAHHPLPYAGPGVLFQGGSAGASPLARAKSLPVNFAAVVAKVCSFTIIAASVAGYLVVCHYQSGREVENNSAASNAHQLVQQQMLHWRSRICRPNADTLQTYLAMAQQQPKRACLLFAPADLHLGVDSLGLLSAGGGVEHNVVIRTC